MIAKKIGADGCHIGQNDMNLKEAKAICSKPIVAIGGINQQNIKSVVDAGVDSVCIATAITLATDPQKTTKTLSNYFNI